MWIARNKDGTLKLFTKVKPWRDSDFYKGTEQRWITDEPLSTECYINPNLFQDLRWEDEPLKARLIICT